MSDDHSGIIRALNGVVAAIEENTNSHFSEREMKELLGELRAINHELKSIATDLCGIRAELNKMRQRC